MKFKLTEKYRPASRLRHAQKNLQALFKSFENKDKCSQRATINHRQYICTPSVSNIFLKLLM